MKANLEIDEISIKMYRYTLLDKSGEIRHTPYFTTAQTAKLHAELMHKNLGYKILCGPNKYTLFF